MEVYPTGGMCWRYRYRLNGRAEKVVLGKYPAMTLKAARAKRDRLAEMVASGESPAHQKRLQKVAGADDTTVEEFAERFFREIQAKARKDNTIPRRYHDKNIVPFIGTKPVRDVTVEDVRAIIWRKKDHGFDAAAADIRGLLKRLLDYAVTCDLITANPVMALPMRHIFKPKARQRALTPEEIRVLLQSVYQSNRSPVVSCSGRTASGTARENVARHRTCTPPATRLQTWAR